MGEGAPFVVQAIYSFKGTNNDELAFEKGDVITVTQIEEGGWWEGTLDGKTGWFPSNYVKECKKTDSLKSQIGKVSQEVLIQQKSYRNQVLHDLLESEKQHVSELQVFKEKYLDPLLSDEVLTTSEFSQLIGNYGEITEKHKEFLDDLEICSNKALHEQCVGKLFIKYASKFKSIQKCYCENHPRAVCVLEKYKDELSGFIESKGGGSPGILLLTTGLSRPFRRLDKYPGILQELERQMEESHKDRGDTQRSVHVYNDICHACTISRRQKEMELEVLTGTIRGWEGDEPSQLGDILHMGLVSIGEEKKDRYLVLFPFNLVILSVSSRMSGFIFENKFQLPGIAITKIDEKVFEITGLLIDTILVTCASKEDADNWVDLLKKNIKLAKVSAIHKSQASQLHPHHNSLPIPPHGSLQSSIRQPHASSVQLPGNSLKMPPLNYNKVWRLSSLQPAPPLRPCISSHKEDNKRTGKQFRNDHCHSDDAKILRVIEAYCTSAKTRYTVSSALLDSPQILIAEEEKIIVEDSGAETIIEEKSLVDTVYALRDEMRILKERTELLNRELEDERSARLKFQKFIKSRLLAGDDISLEE